MVMCGEAFLPVMTPLVQQCCSSPVSQQAVEVMCFVPKRCDDMMSLGRLRGFEVWAPAGNRSSWAQVLELWILIRNYLLSISTGVSWECGGGEGEAGALFRPFLCFLRGHVLWFQGKLTAQGKLLGQDTFLVTEPEAGGLLSSRGRERRVFLFEQIVIFSEALGGGGRGGTQPGYVYKSSIKVGRGHQEGSRLGRVREASRWMSDSWGWWRGLQNLRTVSDRDFR